MGLTIGQQLGTYRVVRLLGKGGMGAVYEVEHAQLGVHYALKTFTLEEGHVEVLKNKFLRPLHASYLPVCGMERPCA